MAESPCKPSTDLTEDAEKLLEKIAQLLADQDRVKPVPNQDLFFGVTDNATNESITCKTSVLVLTEQANLAFIN